MARSWPQATQNLASTFDVTEGDMELSWPPYEYRRILLDLYFTYVHPVLPVLHKESFWRDYEAR